MNEMNEAGAALRTSRIPGEFDSPGHIDLSASRRICPTGPPVRLPTPTAAPTAIPLVVFLMG